MTILKVNMFVFLLLLMLSTVIAAASPQASVQNCSVSFDHVYHGVHVDCSNRGFSQIPKDFPDNITSIELGGNKIVTVSNDSFVMLHNLYFLSLEGNRISLIENSAFATLNCLEILRINANNVCLKGDVLDGLSMLKELALDGCISGRIFTHLHGLQTLVVYANGIVSFDGCTYLKSLVTIKLNGPINLQNNSFAECKDLKNLKTIAIEGPISYLQKCAFCHVKVEVVSMVHTQIGIKKTLSSLYGLQNTTLAALKMNRVIFLKTFHEGNEAKNHMIYKEDMHYLLNMCIKSLTFSFNDILYIDLPAIERSLLGRCLTHLDLSRNRLKYFPVLFLSLFYTMENLTYFDLSNQDRRKPPDNNYYGSVETLQYASLYKRNSSTGNGYIFTLPPKLQVLNMSGYSPSSGHINAPVMFRNAKHFKVMDLSYDGVSYLKTFDGLESLKELDLSGNEIQLPDTFFDFIPTLEILKMNDKAMKQDTLNLKAKHFLRSLHLLKSLHINKNHLFSIPWNLFEFNPLLEYLDLSDNVFIVIPVDLNVMKSILTIDLSFNSIGSLDPATCSKLDRKYAKNNSFFLEMKGNYLSCSCDNFSFLSWFRTTDMYSVKGNNVTCITSSGHLSNTGQISKNFVKFWRHCMGPTSYSYSFSLLTILICSILTALLVATNQTKLANIIINILRHQIPKRHRRDFLQDVYVSYAERDYKWICHRLRPALEDRNLSLFLWDRDSVPGDSIPDQIVENVRSSWKIVLFFSENFEKDHWSYITMMAAINGVDVNDPERLLLLLPDDKHPRIPDCLLDVVPESCIFTIPKGVRKKMHFGIR